MTNSDAFEITETQTDLPPVGDAILKLAKKQPLTVSRVKDELFRPEVINLINALTEAENTIEELQDEAKQKKRKLLLKLLVVVDSLDRIIRHTDSQNETAASLQILRTQFLQFLEDEEVEIVDIKIGQPFDANVCEASQKTQREDIPEGTILFIDQNGYFWQSKLLRKARVTASTHS